MKKREYNVFYMVFMIAFLIIVIGGLLFNVVFGEESEREIKVNFLEIQQLEENEFLAIYVSHEEKAFFEMEISKYESEYMKEHLSKITEITELKDTKKLERFKCVVEFEGEKRILEKQI